MEHFDGRLRIGEPAAIPFDPAVIPTLGRRTGPSGTTVTHFADLESFDFAIVVDVPADSGHVTSHYHERKLELKYIALGAITARYWDADDAERANVVEVTLTTGMTDRIEPGVVHSYHATNLDCIMIELAHNAAPDDIHHLDP